MEGGTTKIPHTVREIAQLYLDQIDLLTVKIDDLTSGGGTRRRRMSRCDACARCREWDR